YNIKVTNTGNVTLHDVVVTDPLVTDLLCDPISPVATLAPGDEINCTASYAVQAGDLGDGKSVTNEACADDGNGDGDTGAAKVCDDVTVFSKAQPGISTADYFVPQDEVTLSGIAGASPTGDLYIALRINQAGAAAGARGWTHTGTAVQAGVYKTADLTGADKNTVQVSADATIRWCTSYSGDANNAARPLSSRSEISSIDFDPS